MSPTPGNAARIINLMQFARKAGKIVSGTEACLRALHRNSLYLLIMAGDTAPRTISRINNATLDSGGRIQVLQLSDQAELSAALGLPRTAIFGVLDKQFASKMLEYYAA